MANSKIEEREFRLVSERTGLSVDEIHKVVYSFFGVLVNDARRLPFDNPKKIYNKQAFDSLSAVVHIPYIGRIGPTYNNYIKWRGNVASAFNMLPRPKKKPFLTDEERETLASILIGSKNIETISCEQMLADMRKDREPKKDTTNVWLVGKDAKRLANQIIKNDK